MENFAIQGLLQSMTLQVCRCAVTLNYSNCYWLNYFCPCQCGHLFSFKAICNGMVTIAWSIWMAYHIVKQSKQWSSHNICSLHLDQVIHAVGSSKEKLKTSAQPKSGGNQYSFWVGGGAGIAPFWAFFIVLQKRAREEKCPGCQDNQAEAACVAATRAPQHSWAKQKHWPCCLGPW